MKSFRDVIVERIPLLFDGAIGTELYKRGMFINRCFEEANLSNRSLVLDLHRDYRQAGAAVLTTNSWGGNCYKLKGHSLCEKVREICLEAALLAREIAKDELYVAGSVGPLGARMEPLGSITETDALVAFREQIEGLVEGGVDFLFLETFADIGEIKQAILAAKSIEPDIPVCSCLTINLSGELELGPSLESAMQKLDTWGSDAIGLNCSVGPQPMLSAIRKIKSATTKPLIVEPNAGLPKEVDGRTIYMATPEYFAEFTKYFLQEGVQFVGGCCGTSPDHIRAMSQTMRQHKAMQRHWTGGISSSRAIPTGEVQDESAKVARVSFTEKSNWTAKIARGEKVYTVELLPPAGITPGRLLEHARHLKGAGIDAINIPDGPRASSRMSSTITAILIEQKIGIETILHYTCRDRNLIGMQSDMMGAHVIGLRNLLLITGDPPKLGDYPNATGVFDIDSIGLARMVHLLNGGIDIGGRPIGEPTALSIGVGVNPAHPDFEFEMKRFSKKIESGAEWAITQPVFDVNIIDAFLDCLAARDLRIPIIMGIWPLTSLRNAQFMNNEVPGISIPTAIMKRMAEAQSPQAARDEGVEIARDMLSNMIDRVQGIQLAAPFGRIDLALMVIGK